METRARLVRFARLAADGGGVTEQEQIKRDMAELERRLYLGRLASGRPLTPRLIVLAISAPPRLHPAITAKVRCALTMLEHQR